MKKLLSLLLAVMMLASCIPAFADDTWKITPEGALSVNSGVKLSGEVVIPETVDGITVTSLDGFAFNNQTDVTSIVMPDTVQSMGSGGAGIHRCCGKAGVIFYSAYFYSATVVWIVWGADLPDGF